MCLEYATPNEESTESKKVQAGYGSWVNFLAFSSMNYYTNRYHSQKT